MSTLENLIDQTRNRLQGTHRAQRNVLNADVNASASQLTMLRDVTNIATGSILELGLEQVYVWEVAPASKQIEVERGQNGTVATSHVTSEIVIVNPEVNAQSIADEINVELGSLSSPENGLYAVETVDFEFDAAVVGYEIDVDRFLDVLTVRYEVPGVDGLWPEVTHWRVKRDADTTEFPSGVSLVLYDGGYPAHTVRVTTKQGFGSLSTLASTAASTGLPGSAHDILSLGAAARLLAAREGQRAILGPRSDSERAENVPPGANIGASRHLLAIRQQRIAEERSTLARLYPARRTV